MLLVIVGCVFFALFGLTIMIAGKDAKHDAYIHHMKGETFEKQYCEEVSDHALLAGRTSVIVAVLFGIRLLTLF